LNNNQPRIALITGSAKRIGAAIARRLHGEGYALALHYRHSAAEVHALVAELETVRSGSTLLLQADLTDVDCLPALVAKTVDHFGRLNALVNNASAYYATPFGQATPQQWDELFASNARAPFFLSQAAAPHLRVAHGAIVNIADVYAVHPRADLSLYAASKAALVSLTQSLALAFAPDVRVNAIAPGAIEWPEIPASDDHIARILQATPLARKGTVDEVAAAVVWLLHDAGYMTGQVLRIDGGRNIAG
jgi:pteridine reductase